MQQVEMVEDHFAPSPHIFLCLSTHQPPVQILSLNYCTQYIPVYRTHAYVHAHIAKYFTSQTSQN